MAKCEKCNTYLPPGFVHSTDPYDGTALPCNTCEFCLKDTKIITYDDGKQVSKRDLEKEYILFIKKIKEDSSILKNIAKGEQVKGKSNLIL